MSLSKSLHTKYTNLIADLHKMEKALLAFSGGVDSTLLLHAAKEALGDKLLAVTFVTPYSPKKETEEAISYAERLGVQHRLINLPIHETLLDNPPERCYLCKNLLFKRLVEIAEDEGYACIIDGSNLDDLDDYRPGFKAVKELGIASPLLKADLTKRDIRDISREFDLPTWNKPAGACLLTRLPHGTIVNSRELERIDKGEEYLKSLGFSWVRLRSHGTLARIELTVDSIALCTSPEMRARIDKNLKELGYHHVTVDLAGYRMGSLNEKETNSGTKE